MKEPKVAFTHDAKYWYKGTEIDNKHEACKALDLAVQIIFCSCRGICIEASNHNITTITEPTWDMLDYLCKYNSLGPSAKAKLWFSAFKYSMLNAHCRKFHEKYEETIGPNYFAVVLAQPESETYDANHSEK